MMYSHQRFIPCVLDSYTQCNKENHLCSVQIRIYYKRGSRGGDRGSGNPPPPLRFVGDGVLCGYFMGRRGVQRLFLSYFYNFFLARSACQYYTKWKYLKILNHFQVQKAVSLLPSYTLPLAFMKVPFPCLHVILTKITWFYTIKTKNFWGGPPDPPPPPPPANCDIHHLHIWQSLHV